MEKGLQSCSALRMCAAHALHWTQGVPCVSVHFTAKDLQRNLDGETCKIEARKKQRTA
jgi:hypothetical protein